MEQSNPTLNLKAGHDLPMYPCPLCKSTQVQLCMDGNNAIKDLCKCRDCGCTALRSVWNLPAVRSRANDEQIGLLHIRRSNADVVISKGPDGKYYIQGEQT